MPPIDWRRSEWREREAARRARRDDLQEREDFGQADYSSDYAYDPGARSGYRIEERMRAADDYGQADYSSDWGYDADRRRPYRRYSDEDRQVRAPEVDRYDRYRRFEEDRRDRGEPRSFADRAGDFFTGRGSPDERREQRRRGPSDQVLWAVIVERLEDERGLDLRDVDVLVDNGEVTLNGTVRRKIDKRRIEDIADIEDVRHVQNNLRVRERSAWSWF